MTKIHLNDKGDPGKCSATIGRCPFGDEAQHYPSMKEARAAFERMMTDETFNSHQKIEKQEHQTDLLHNMNYERIEPVNRVTVFDGDRVYAIYIAKGPEGMSLYESYGNVTVTDAGITPIWSNETLIGPDTPEGRNKATEHYSYAWKQFGSDASVRSNLITI